MSDSFLPVLLPVSGERHVHGAPLRRVEIVMCLVLSENRLPPAVSMSARLASKVAHAVDQPQIATGGTEEGHGFISVVRAFTGDLRDHYTET